MTARFVALDTDRLDIPADTWIHFAAVRRHDVLEIYVNGDALASQPQRGSKVNDVASHSSLKLGHRGDPHDTLGSTDARGMYLKGAIDEAHVWSGTALTAQDIQAIVDAREADLCSIS